MTVRELYRNTLIELNKEEASALYVEDFLYYANKAVNWYVNARYNSYDTSQQVGDDLRVLKVGPEEIDLANTGKAKCLDKCGTKNADCKAVCDQIIDDTVSKGLCHKKCNVVNAECVSKCNNNLLRLEYDYRHLLNCIIEVKLHSYAFGCEQKPNSVKSYSAKRMTSDRKAAILNNVYLEPTFYRPYYDIVGDNLELLVGDDDKDKFNVKSVKIEYLKNPRELKLLNEQLLIPEDTSDELEFPEYVCVEILNAVVMLVMEQAGEPRLATNMQVNQSINTIQSAGTPRK